MLKRAAKTVEEKIQIIEEMKKGATVKTLSEKYGCIPVTIRRIRDQEAELYRLAELNGSYRKRLSYGRHREVETALYEWYNAEIKKEKNIKTSLILAKAEELSTLLGRHFIPHFTWLKRWKMRFGIEDENKQYEDTTKKENKQPDETSVQESKQPNQIESEYKKTDETIEVMEILQENTQEIEKDGSTSSFEEMVCSFLDDEETRQIDMQETDSDYTLEEKDSSVEENDLYEHGNDETELLKHYTIENILNASAIGFLYKELPKTKDALNTPQQQQQERLTILFVSNATGSFKRIFVIGKYQVSNSDILPLPYYVNKEACMTEGLWIKILKSLDNDFNNKVLMYADIPICRTLPIKLKNITLKLSLPTDAIQPLDQGIIEAFKREYRQIIVRKHLIALELGKTTNFFMNSISISKALSYTKQAWNMIKNETIFKAFDEAGFLQSKSVSASGSNDLYENIPNWQEFLHCDDYVGCYGENAEYINSKGSRIEKKTSNISTNKDELKNAFIAVRNLDRLCRKHELKKIQENLPGIEEELLKFAKETTSQNETT